MADRLTTRRSHVLRAIFVVACLGLLAACASEPPPVPPAALQPTTAEVDLVRLWSSEAGESEGARFEPLVVADQLIVANHKGTVTSYAADNGMRRWRRKLGVRLSSGVGGSAEQIYVSDENGGVHALNPVDGEPVWHAQGSSEVLVPVVAKSGIAVVRSSDGRVVALSQKDGKELWAESNTPPALTLNGYSRPLLLEGGVLIGLDDGRLLALNLNTGKVIWETVISVPTGRSEVERLVDIDADIVIDDEGIYVANYQGKAARIEPARGQIVWSVPLSAGSGITQTVKSLIVVDDKDTVLLLDKKTGQQRWSNDSMTGRRLSPPVITSTGDVLVGDVEGYLHVLDISTGDVVGRTQLTNKPITSRPVAHDKVVYVQASDGLVAAYRFAR